MSNSGSELRNNNERIVQLMALLRAERDEMSYLIEKQRDEKGKIENEIEKLSFKLTLLTKSLNQRLQAKMDYDKTIGEIEGNYVSLVQESGKLLTTLSNEVQNLEEIMDKKTETAGSTTIERAKEPETTEEEEDDEKEPPPPDDGPPSPAPEPPEAQDVEPIKQPSATSRDASDASPERKSQSSRSSRRSEDARSADDRSEAERELPMAAESDPSQSDDQSEKPQNKRYLEAPPPIRKKGSVDVELQSYREAYERQHKAASPPHSISGVPASAAKSASSSRRSSKRSFQ